MIEYKQNIAARLPVRIVDSSGTPVAGVVFGSITATALKSDGSTATITVTAPDWVEISTGAFAGEGFYTLSVSAAILNTTGIFTYAVDDGTNKVYIGAVKVVANEEVDTYTVTTAVAADVATIPFDVWEEDLSLHVTPGTAGEVLGGLGTDLAAMESGIDTLVKHAEGRWKIHVSGPDANRLVIYDTDDVTPLVKFDLKDPAGSATSTLPFERVKVP